MTACFVVVSNSSKSDGKLFGQRRYRDRAKKQLCSMRVCLPIFISTLASGAGNSSLKMIENTNVQMRTC
jgi:hypothetical protein